MPTKLQTNQIVVNFIAPACTFGNALWYNSVYGTVRRGVIAPAAQNRNGNKPAKEAVLIDPKQERRISMQGAKTPQDAATAANGGPNQKKTPKKKRRSIVGYVFRFIGCLLCVCVMLGSVGAVLLSMYVVQVTADDQNVLDLDSLKLSQTSIYYDSDGNEAGTFVSGDSNSVWRSLSDMPANLQNAVIAIEDKDFKNEPGINLKRTIGAALNQFTGNKIYGSQQGASTLEQQLIKNLTGDDEQDNMRKVREIFRAIGLANRYSKETILEAYLNRVPLTGIVVGMEAGATTYFGKSVEDLTLAECATLASITKNPKTYNPITNPEMLIARRNHVLAEMFNQGYITQEERDSAQAETVVLAESNAVSENATRTSTQSYFGDALFEQLTQDIMETKGYDRATAQDEIFSGGLRIYSTVNSSVQASVEKMMLNEADEKGNEQFPALWHEEEVDSLIPVGSEITYGEDGLPINPDGTAIFGDGDEPIYSDEDNTVLKTGTSEDGANILFYENVRTQASIAVLDYDGGVVAIGGGLGEKKYDRGTNRATLPHQTGSTMKPIAAYCLALQNHIINYSRPMSDSPYYSKADKKVLNEDYCRKNGLSLDAYSAANLARDDVWRDWPENYGGAGGDGATMLVYDALRRSYNTVAVWIGSYVGADNLYDFVHDTLQCQYLDPESDADLAPMVLGSQSRGLTAVEMAGAFSMFNDGTFTTPHYYTTVEDYQGNMYLDNTKRISTVQAISPETATIMNRLLYNVLHDSQGTAYGMAPEMENGMESVAKTGTTSDYKDYTFAGLTPYYVTAMWWGFDKPHDMYNLGGKNGKPMQYAWKALMEEVQADLPLKEFYRSENVVEKQFDPTSGNIISSGGLTGYYTEDNLPGGNSVTQTDSYTEQAQQAADAANQTEAQTTEPQPAAPATTAPTTDNGGGIQIS